MRRSRGLILWIVACQSALLGGSQLLADPPAQSSQPQRAGATAAWPEEVLILNGAADLDEFWTRLARPDLIITRPGPSKAAVPAAPRTDRDRTHTVNALKVRGRVDGSVADLMLEIELSLLVSGPVWVPLGIDCPVISTAREGDRELELKRTARGPWEVRIEGNGSHRLHCAVKVPVSVTPDRKQLDLGIPEALSSYFELEVPQKVFEVELGSGEAIGKSPLAQGKGTRLSGHFFPRSRLTLGWIDEDNSSSGATPFLAARMEIAIDADSEWITTLSSWEIRCIRGVARSLEIKLDEPEIVRLIKLDDQLLVERIERNVLTIPLGEPLRANGIRRLTLQTRRAVPSGSPGRLDFNGYSLANSLEQSGAIGITPTANVWIQSSLTRGLRRIDPGELPKNLRAHPGISLAYQFLDQPFQLGLEIEESPPLFRTETSSVVTLDGELARTETTIKVQRIRGRLFEIEVEIPAGLELGSVDPTELVEAIVPVTAPSQAAAPGRPGGSEPRILRLRLSASARDQRSISLKLLGQQRVVAGGPASIGLFSPRGSVSVGNTVTLFGTRDLSFETTEGTKLDGTQVPSVGEFLLQPLIDRALNARSDRLPIAVLKSHMNPTVVQGTLLRHPRKIVSTSKIDAQVSAQGVEVNQVTTLSVRHGSMKTISIQVPLGPTDSWQVYHGNQSVRREELSGDEGGMRRYRLHFDPPVLENATLEFRFRLPFDSVARPGAETKAAVPWIVIDEGTSVLSMVTLDSSPDLQISVDDKSWTLATNEVDSSTSDEPSRRYRLVDPSRPPEGRRLPFTIRAMDRVSLPPVVVPRALLRSVLGTDHQARTRAWFWVEVHPSELSFQLPEGSRWIRASIDGRAAEQLETNATGSGYRMLLPPESRSKPVLIELEYQSDVAGARPVLSAPKLEQDAVVLQSFWIVEIPWSEAVIGVPTDWGDENEWYWDSIVWKRRPWRTLSRLLSWVSGSTASLAGLGDPQGEEPESAHAYLFGRAGEPSRLPLTVASRAWLVAACSGSVLLAGFLVMFMRVSFRVIWIVAATLGLLMAIFSHPSVALLIVQSAMFGIILTLAGLATQRLVERSRPVPPAGVSTAQSGLTSAVSGSPNVGSDDSTAIRVRVSSSTMDHVAASRQVPVSEAESAAGSRVGPAL